MEPSTIKTWGSYSPEEKERAIRERAICNSTYQLHFREYYSEAQFPHLLDAGISLVKTILPEPITKEELEAMLAPVHPGEEFSHCGYVRDMEALLVYDHSDHGPFVLLRQRLESRIDVLAKELDDQDLTLVNFHTLLGIYLLNLAKEQGLVTPSEKRNYFIRKDISP
ncbi:hypothetical protein HZC30_04495 [Candidatus Woesearchaeota archaeon]|nr:hypothetical protein [Candidatus Woesearchaeota archaeon]